MNTQTLSSPAATTTARMDVYTSIHKALRAAMSDTLRRVGRLDVHDDEEREAVCSNVQALLQQLRSHLQHENDFIHAAIEARRPGGARLTAEDHVQHLDSIGNLDDEAQALRHARAAQRQAMALRLYRHLALFVAENLEHMQLEETENQATLWALYSDAEIAQMHDRLVASIGPDEMALTVRWMAAALPTQDLVDLFSGVRANAPAPAFAALLDVACTQLDEGRRARLMRALGLPPVPGLVTA